jgi:integrase
MAGSRIVSASEFKAKCLDILDRVGRREQPGACGARTKARRQARQDAGFNRGASTAAAREHQGVKTVTLPDGSEGEAPWLVGLRDRALIGVMVYSFARISAVVSMQVEDYFANGKRWWVRLQEKGGKRHEMPEHHKLEQFLDEYLEAAGIGGEDRTFLFRSAAGKTGILTDRPMHRVDPYQMVRRRTAEAGLKGKLGCHVFARPGSPPILRQAALSRSPSHGGA